MPIVALLDLSIAEAEYLAEHELIYELEDLCRRRTMISLMHNTTALIEMPAFNSLVKLLFGDEAEEKLKRFKDAMDITSG